MWASAKSCGCLQAPPLPSSMPLPQALTLTLVKGSQGLWLWDQLQS